MLEVWLFFELDMTSLAGRWVLVIAHTATLWAAALDHKTWLVSVERKVVVETLIDQIEKVFGCDGGFGLKDLHLDLALGGVHNYDWICHV